MADDLTTWMVALKRRMIEFSHTYRGGIDRLSFSQYILHFDREGKLMQTTHNGLVVDTPNLGPVD